MILQHRKELYRRWRIENRTKLKAIEDSMMQGLSGFHEKEE